MMANDKLGFTFYPKDWWTSDSFEDFTSMQRYLYLECMFLMYSNGGFLEMEVSNIKIKLEKRLKNPIDTQDWEILKPKFIATEHGVTFESVLKRLRKTLANRQNGLKGGRPKKEDNFNPIITEVQTHGNPPLEYKEKEKENIILKDEPTEAWFIKRWKDARFHYDKLPTGFEKLSSYERSLFKEIVKDFSKKQIEAAIKGLFFQKTVPAVRVRPDWILKPENFEKMLDCALNNNKLFEDKKPPESTTPKFQKGDV